ncbi:DNA topoisomerase IB [Haloferula chungangensis]|uniref:DNA topoisomerase IB n=1 Tax=Haloferula chungangensis TaxID=1048331 RepID=A0ABW2L2Z5_9BACT
MKKAKSARCRRVPGLVYTNDGMPGYRRRRAGRGFRYLLPKGAVLRDQPEIDRIKSLAIPPAYDSVWICMKPHGHLQATGMDERGRKQYRYHPRWHRFAAERKFSQLPEFALALPKIRKRARAALEEDGDARGRVIAGIVSLLDRTGFRIGSRRYADENHTYGLASLLSRHVKKGDEGWTMRFRGKSGKLHRAIVDDSRIAKLIDDLQDLPGQYLFCHKIDGRWRPIGSTDVNHWLKEVSGGDITAKHFRTWRASLHCARELAKEDPPESVAEIKRTERQAICNTAEVLNNTAAVCRKYYIHPAVFDAYRSGVLRTKMSKPAPRMRKSDDSSKLKADERRLLWLIEHFDGGRTGKR